MECSLWLLTWPVLLDWEELWLVQPVLHQLLDEQLPLSLLRPPVLQLLPQPVLHQLLDEQLALSLLRPPVLGWRERKRERKIGE